MKHKLTDEEKSKVLPGVRMVLSGGTDAWKAPELHFPVGALIDALTDIPGLDKREGFESNGWQWDWRQGFRYLGQDYTLSGSGYYGGVKFFQADAEPED